MAQCRQCGYELAADFKFCPQCTTPVVAMPVADQAQPHLLFGIPLGVGEQELYRDMVSSESMGFKDVFLLTTQQLMVVKNPKAWFGAGKVLIHTSLKDIATVKAVHENSRYLVQIDLRTRRLVTGVDVIDQQFSHMESFDCQSYEQAMHLARKIRLAM